MCARPAASNCAQTASRQARNSGLTLIELLVALSVLSLVAVLGWRGLDSIVRARATLGGGLEQTRGAQLAFAQLQSDCAHLASAAILPNRAPIIIGQERLTLVRTVFADNQPSRLQVVAYRVKDGVLTRRESASTRDLAELDSLWQAATNDLGAAQPVALQSGVAALTMRLWINGGWNTGINAPPAPIGINMVSTAPAGLEVALQLQGRETSLLKIFLLGAV